MIRQRETPSFLIFATESPVQLELSDNSWSHGSHVISLAKVLDLVALDVRIPTASCPVQDSTIYIFM